MEEKLFLEVFPDLNIEDDLRELLRNVTIKNITINRDHTAMRVYIRSGRLINKSAIYTLEKKLTEHFRVGKHINLHIIEEYNLSSQYTTENLFEIYKESFFMEIKEQGILAANMFKKAKVSFEGDNVVCLQLETNIASEAKQELIKKTLSDIYLHRFGMPVEVRIVLKEGQKGKYVEENKKKLEIETENVLKKIAKLHGIEVSEMEGGILGEEQTSGAENEAAGNSPGNMGAQSGAGNNVGGNGSAGKAQTGKRAAGKGFGRNSGQRFEGASPVLTLTRSDNPDVLYGRDFEFDEEVSIDEIYSDIGSVVIKGQILNIDQRAIRGERTIITLTITDFTDTITAKIFLKDELLEEFNSKIKKKMFIRLKGVAMFDTYDRGINIQSVVGVRKATDFRTYRQDNAVRKRIELHCHTKMSDMDGVSDVKKIVKQAYDWGHKAIAITDHGVVQGFPDAWHEYCDLKGAAKKAGKDFDFKVIYGVEAYLVDDLQDVIVNSKGQSIDDTYVVFDLETTGLSPVADKIIEFGAVKVQGGKIIDRFSTFVNPERPIPFNIEKLTGINDNMVIDAPLIDKVLPEFLDFCEGCIMVAHNAGFDMSFIENKSREMGIEREYTIIDTVAMSQFLVVGLGKYTLDSIAKALQVQLINHHRAVEDAECTALVFLKLLNMLRDQELTNLDEINKQAKLSDNRIKKAHAYHAIILCKNDVGRVNLYKLISDAHLNNFYRKPRILKSKYMEFCEGLMIGSACEAGELYQAILHGKSDVEISRLCEFYDYYEIQPLGNNQFMLRTGDPEIDNKKKFLLDSEQDLIDINKKIIALGKKFNKLVVATCDVHFLNPEDEVYRRIIQFGNGFKDADVQPPLYLRTTEEMLAEFSYLDSQEAEDLVINNPARINDMIEDISPIHPDKCPPVIENSDVDLRTMCYNTAHGMYGDPLPEYVQNRLDKELNSIISNGYAVMYIMAQRLVKHSNDDGYLVGSRGSVGSSFVATMSGITEVNPLKPHYYCKKCQYSEFDSEDIINSGAGVGFDLPDKVCPNCGETLVKDGFDIPFETFLGFYGDKEPDIDLNFSGENQPEAHRYTGVMFGFDHTYRAGTITGVAEKTAYGYVKGYFEDHDITKRRCEIERIAAECTGVRKSTGQHPGGIVIVPKDKEIYEFTPIQKPANDMTAKSITTHFEYHAIDANLLKLDILGHDDPTMIRTLEKYTDTDAKKIPFDDQKVMSLFESPEALGITPEQIGGVKLGSLGLPELGTDFVLRMLEEAKPKQFSDLVRISGLSHGTDVWTGNAQELIKQGLATISTAICTRDDIMTYLISKNIEPGISFKIMEAVRKGKGLTPENEEIMREHEVPEWYIDSCKKIKYMFPKAHAAAYIMMALRVAWYKVYYPLAYYAAFFGIRAKAFNYEMMCQGPEKLNYYIEDHLRRKERGELSKKDEDSLKDMNIVREMYARGFEFLPIDIYKAKAHEFQIMDGKLMPALDTIEGMGENAADGVEEAAKNGEFLSKDDFRERSKVTKTVVETMTDLGLLEGLPDGNQLSLFDFQI